MFMLKGTNVSSMLKSRAVHLPSRRGINKQLQMRVSALMYVSYMCDGTRVSAGVGVVTTCCL